MGWYILAVAILYPTPVGAEDAESIFYTGKKGSRPGVAGRKPDDQFNCALLEARLSGMQYKDIGKLYGMSTHAVFKRIKRAKNIFSEECYG